MHRGLVGHLTSREEKYLDGKAVLCTLIMSWHTSDAFAFRVRSIPQIPTKKKEEPNTHEWVLNLDTPTTPKVLSCTFVRGQTTIGSWVHHVAVCLGSNVGGSKEDRKGKESKWAEVNNKRYCKLTYFRIFFKGKGAVTDRHGLTFRMGGEGCPFILMKEEEEVSFWLECHAKPSEWHFFPDELLWVLMTDMGMCCQFALPMYSTSHQTGFYYLFIYLFCNLLVDKV